MIDLVNRRFVPFFFNRSGQGQGDDPAARAFTEGKTENPYAYFAAFSADGEYLGESDLYADKDAVFAFLAKLLEEHPELARASDDEEQLLRGAAEFPDNATIRLGAARFQEELGDYDAALETYDWLATEHAQSPEALEALLGSLRIHRYRAEWAAHAQRLAQLTARSTEPPARVRGDVAAERGYELVAAQRWQEARELLQPLTSTTPTNARLAELHFLAGLACWFQDDRDWAKFHWVQLAETLPDDRLYRRAYIAAAAEAMPYANPELAGYEAPVGNIGTENIVRGYQAAKLVHAALLPRFEAGEFAHELDAAVEHGSALLLVAALRDGNEHLPANNAIVDQLVAMGPAAVPSLVAALEDEAFPGRGYSGWALALVLKASATPDPEALALLERVAASDENTYVRLLSTSGLNQLRAKGAR